MLNRKKIAMIMAEFLGTGALTLAILAVSRSTIGIPYFVSIAAAVVVAAMYLLLHNVSGAHLNPIVSLGMWSVRRAKTLPTIVYVAAQFLGAAGAYLLYTYFIGQTWGNTGHFTGRVLVAESVGALVFSMGWAAVVYNKLEAGRAAAVIGLSLLAGMLVASAASAALINPALALGVRSWVWGTYVLGPVLGGVIGFNLYALLFAPASKLIEKPAKKK
jgi:glycerol uptake facilitator protein